MKTDMRLSLISMSILFAVNTEAATVGWWRFDDYGTNAHKTVSTDSFSNHVDSTKFPMYPKTFYDQTEGTNETYMPTTTNTFGKWNKLRIYDPVSDTTHFVGNSLATTWGGDGSKQSGGAVIADNPDLRGGSNADGSFTWECIFKADADALLRSSSMSPLLGQKSADYDGCWSLMPRYENGKVSLWCRGKVKKNSDGTLASACTTSGQPPYVTPDVWHHAALSFDGSTGQFRIYLDYTLVSTSSEISGGGRVAPGIKSGSNIIEDIYIAKGRYTADRSFLGEIAEVRCSDTRLTENDFLRFDEVYLGDRVSTDSDTVFWYSLDSMKSFESFLVDYPHLATTNGHPERVNFCALLQPDEYTQAGFTDSVVNAAVRPDLRGGPVWTNTASLALAVKDSNPNSYIKVSDPMLMIPSDDFTEEFYFKTYSAPASGKYYGLMYSSFCKVLLYSSGDILVRSYCDEGTTDHSYFNINLCDGNYHHYAFGYKASEKKIYIYLDHALQGTIDGTLPCKKSASTAHVVGQAREYSPPQVFDGEIDELRLTRRLLTPDEFIGRGSYFNTNVMAHIRFDGDYSIWPWIGDRLTTTPYCDDAPANTIVNEVKAGNLIIKSEAGEELQLANTGSTHTWGGGWYYNNIRPDIAQSNVTIEFFWKACEKHAPWFTVLGVAPSGTYVVNISNETAPWVVGYSGTWDYSQLALRMTTKTDSQTYSELFSFGVRNTVPQPPAKQSFDDKGKTYWAPCVPDGKWHHIAITFEEIMVEDVLKTKATVYWDYEKNTEKTLTGTLNFSVNHQNRLCGRGYPGRAPEFLTDEIRITKGILQPKDFIRLKHLKGGCILLW